MFSHKLHALKVEPLLALISPSYLLANSISVAPEGSTGIIYKQHKPKSRCLIQLHNYAIGSSNVYFFLQCILFSSNRSSGCDGKGWKNQPQRHPKAAGGGGATDEALPKKRDYHARRTDLRWETRSKSVFEDEGTIPGVCSSVPSRSGCRTYLLHSSGLSAPRESTSQTR